MEDFTIDIAAAATPFGWTAPVLASTTAAPDLGAATVTMPPAPTNNRSVNYIGSSTAAAGSLRPDLDAKQAAPPRGNLR